MTKGREALLSNRATVLNRGGGAVGAVVAIVLGVTVVPGVPAVGGGTSGRWAGVLPWGGEEKGKLIMNDKNASVERAEEAEGTQ